MNQDCRTLLAIGLTAAGLSAAYFAVLPRPVTPAFAETVTSGPSPRAIELTDTHRQGVPTAPVATRAFAQEVRAIGNIDFNEDASVAVMSPYNGRIKEVLVRMGDEVRQGQPLFVVDSADLMQAEATAIQAAGVLQLTRSALVRARALVGQQGVSQRDLEQAVSDQQTAEANLNAAKDTLRLFGKAPEDIERIIATRRVDGNLMVTSLAAGRVTSRNAQPGLYVQAGGGAVLTVTDLSTMWLMSYVTEVEVPRFRVGQPLQASVPAHPGIAFLGTVRAVGSTVDPNTRRLLLRSEIVDPDHMLANGMFADFRVQVGAPVTSPCAPVNAVVREGDGTMTAFVTDDGGRTFHRRAIRTGLLQDGFHQVLDGLKPGEVIATDNAIFVAQAIAAAATR